MTEWASFARPDSAGTRIAALIGVAAPAASDAGMPVRLALRADGGSPVRTAAVADQPTVAAVSAPAVAAPAAELASVAPVAAPMSIAPAAEPMPVEVAAAAAADVPAAAPAPSAAPDVAAMVDSLRTEKVRPSGALPKVAELRRAAAKRFGRSQAVVQLGAYATEAGVKMGWGVIARRHGNLSAYVPASARFVGPRGTVYRLSLKGFESDGEARQLCMQLKAKGASCFVRTVAGDAPVRFAAR